MTNLKSLINKGLVDIYLPIIIIVASLMSLIYLTSILFFEIENPNIIMILGTIVSIAIGWLWWSYKIVKWKILALSELDFEESKELYYKAINAGLIWPKGNVFNKTEIWSDENKSKWLKIESEIRNIFY